MTTLVSIMVDGRTIAGSLTAPTITEPTHESARVPGVIFVHGLDGNQEGYIARAKALSDQFPILSLTLDLSGHGHSEGNLARLTPFDHLRDLTEAFDTLTSYERVDPARIGVCAASYGAYLAVHLSALRPIKSLLLRAPALYEDSQLCEPLASGRRTTASANASQFLETLRKYDGRITVVESGKDKIVTRDVLDLYICNMQHGTVNTIADAGHVLESVQQKALFMEYVQSWAKEL
jgi:uncharacterized protein